MQVKSIKSGMFDSISMYDTFQTLTQQGVANPVSEKRMDNVSIEIEPSEKNATVAIERNLACQQGELYIFANEVLMKFSAQIFICLKM